MELSRRKKILLRWDKHAPEYCSMYGICAQRSDGKILNCPYGVPSVKPDDLLSAKIQSLCPTITGNVCCTSDQFDTLRGQVQQAIPFLVGCPACLRNFLNLFCELSCSPNQSLFINVTSVAKVNNSLTVDGIDFYVTDTYGEELYDSCKEVKFGTMNTRAMEFIGAGAQNYKGENFENNNIQVHRSNLLVVGNKMGKTSSFLLSLTEWLSFIGRQANLNEPGSPYAIRFRPNVSESTGMKPMNVSVYSCADTSLGCSCGDCPSSPTCTAPAPPTPHDKGSCSIKIGSFKMPEENSELKKVSQLSVVQGYISSFYRVETRPEKLWVGPGSEAAEEKQFFDSHLAPFYRIEQLILATTPTSKHQKPPNIVTEDNIQLLFKIQKKVDELRTNYSGSMVSLTDICMKPLGVDCATQSVLQYFKMDPEKYDDYGGVDHAAYCFQHYSSAETCLSAFKAPIDPSTALGGFSGSNYSEASAFVITYPVNNEVDKTGNENGKAVAWEKAFIHLMKVSIGDRGQRAKEALSTMGASVFSGITLTKLVGVIVLRFAKSEVFVVVLSICGPPSRSVSSENQQHPPTAELT
ncbi:hypothetical protein QJS10_CPB15g00237 [Acorus calamus]|uniref:Niemann-Pick C1 N-terminal domain-containing protein n=1 Tax=Acorus calamus TaxID=4465 RepID=A0AAV9D8C6_ACOCL|nr:hypothetical protein QJS10_CPB15g00237 [Acorus calamus]